MKIIEIKLDQTLRKFLILISIHNKSLTSCFLQKQIALGAPGNFTHLNLQQTAKKIKQ